MTWIPIGYRPQRMAPKSSAMFLRCHSAAILTVELLCGKR